MVVKQVYLDVPVDIANGLATGKYKLYGSIVRDSSGHIVKHLKEANIPKSARNIIKNKKALTGVIALGVTVIGSVGYVYYKTSEQKKLAKKFINNLIGFIQLAEKGEVTEDNVEQFITFLKKNEKELLKLNLDSTIDDLLNLIEEYTLKFAEVNGFDSFSNEKNDNKVINLLQHLELQKEIYDSEVA